jgi:hypothetical protein
MASFDINHPVAQFFLWKGFNGAFELTLFGYTFYLATKVCYHI